ncbi:UBC-like protein [Fistulina hepatica ATCC 64428]|nr:UBC-like protein [Fistulina hepatica ATCC 64428]
MLSFAPALDLSSPSRRSRTSTQPRGTASKSRQATEPAAPPAPEAVSLITRTSIALEYASLRHASHCPLGIYVTPSIDNVLVWDAVFFVHQGYYTDAIFKFQLIFPHDYPERPPSVHFLTDVLHPLISQDGVFNLAPRFRPWRPREHHVFDVLHWVKAAFKKHALDEIKESDCLNKEAYRYHDSTSSFAALAAQTSALSQTPASLFDQDHPSMSGASSDGIVFKELKPALLAELCKKIGVKDWDDSGDAE